eukprot:TRINITY_DN21455_c1_g2_i1.p1 TRINITY_DN21455_c1_g2~~TRINITY_DN21455_c1_g2_i1.p1  ORF type:complete len:398 (+),score=87.42 TRINITY_DN21455_c1_g2_i1:75-1196(+)
MWGPVAAAALLAAAAAQELEVLAELGWDHQVTGIAVSGSGRVFVNFPRWQRNFSGPSVAELAGGALVPYPDRAWNSWTDGAPPGNMFVSVQSVVVDHMDRLWIVDPGAAYHGNITPGAPKLLRVNLTTNAVEQIIRFAPEVAPTRSYLNDIRVSADGRWGFLSDSTAGGLVVVDLDAGTARRVLGDHPSTLAEPGAIVTVEGQGMYTAGSSPLEPMAVQSDGIAVLGGYLYYHAMTAWTLYRIPVGALTNASMSNKELARGIEAVARTGFHDGLVVAGNSQRDGVLFLTALEKNGIDFLTSDGRLLPFVSDPRLEWPDSMAAPPLRKGRDNYLYLSCSQINFQPWIADARPRRMPYTLFRFRIPDGIVARYGD